MQASTRLPYYFSTTGATARGATLKPLKISLPGASIAVLTALLLMTTSIPEAGTVTSSEIQPLDGTGTFEELSLEEVVGHFEKRLPPAYRKEAPKLGRLLLELSEKHQFAPTFLLSVIETESSFRVNVTSKAGAVGLMQLLPATAKEIAAKNNIPYKSEADLHKPATNIRLGVAYLSWLRRQFGHSLHYVAAYNLGPTALRRRLNAGNYELGAIDRYVRTIHERTRNLRNAREPEALPALHHAERAKAVLSASL